MPLHKAKTVHAFRTRCADEIGTHDFKHCRTRRPCQQRKWCNAQRESRQDDVAQAAISITKTWQPPERQSEEVHGKQTKPELRQREAGNRAYHRYAVKNASGLERRQKPKWYTDQNSKAHGSKSQFKRRPHTFLNERNNRLPWPGGGTEIKLCQLNQIVAKPHMNRLVEPKLLRDFFNPFRVIHTLAIRNKAGRDASRNNTENDKDQQRYRNNCGYHLQNAADNKIEHTVLLSDQRETRWSKGDQWPARKQAGRSRSAWIRAHPEKCETVFGIAAR